MKKIIIKNPTKQSLFPLFSQQPIICYQKKKKMRKLIGQYIRRNSGFGIYFTEDAKFTEDKEFEQGERERTRRNKWFTLC